MEARLALLCLVLAAPSCGGNTRGGPDDSGGTWGIAASLGSGFQPRIAVDPAGAAVAVWKAGGPLASLVARRFEPAAGWGAAEILGGPSLGAADLEADPAGNVLVAWNQREGDRWTIVVRPFERGPGWTAPIVVSDPESGDHSPDFFATRPAVAVTPSGTAWVLWRQLDGAEHRIWAAPFAPRAGFGPPQLAATGSGNTSPVLVDTDAVGNAVVVWRVFDGTVRHVRAARFRLDRGWLATETLASDPGSRDLSDNPPALAVSAAGEAFVVWATPTGRGETGRIWATRLAGGTAWEAPRLIGPDSAAAPGETPAWSPRVVSDALGSALAVWLQATGPGGVADVWANRFAAGTGWEGPRRVENDAGPAYPPAIAMDPSGAGLAAWFQGAPRPRVFSSRFRPGLGWDQPQTIDTEPAAFLPLAPDVGLDARGNAIVVWSQGTADTARVWANRFTAASGSAPR